jgi:hypothetical protein
MAESVRGATSRQCTDRMSPLHTNPVKLSIFSSSWANLCDARRLELQGKMIRVCMREVSAKKMCNVNIKSIHSQGQYFVTCCLNSYGVMSLDYFVYALVPVLQAR